MSSPLSVGSFLRKCSSWRMLGGRKTDGVRVLLSAVLGLECPAPSQGRVYVHFRQLFDREIQRFLLKMSTCSVLVSNWSGPMIGRNFCAPLLTCWIRHRKDTSRRYRQKVEWVLGQRYSLLGTRREQTHFRKAHDHRPTGKHEVPAVVPKWSLVAVTLLDG